MRRTRRLLWLYKQAACSEPNQQAEAAETTENTMTVSKKFIKILKSSFRIMNNATNQISEMQKKNINAVEAKMDRLFREVIDSKDSKFNDSVTLALSYLYMSYIYIDNNDYTYISKKYLTNSLELLKGRELDCKAILIVMRSLNELSYIETVTRNFIEAESYLNNALQLYFMFTKEKDDYPIPIDVASILDIEDKANCKCLLEQIYETTLKGLLDMDSMIYFVYKRTDISKAAIYMHKQLEKKLNTADIDYIAWAVQSADLSTSFIRYGRFTEARNHLAAANFMIQHCFLDFYQKVEGNNIAMKNNLVTNRYRQATSLIAKQWAKYGLTLLRFSRERIIIQNTEDKPCEARTSQSNESECSTKPERQSKDLLIFFNIEKDLEEFAAPITDKCPLNYKEAKKVFVSVLKWYNDVETYVTDITDDVLLNKLEEQCSIAIGLSTAYKYLAYYEQDKSNKIKLHKRRINIIEKVMKTLKSTVATEKYKELCAELICIYKTMLDMMTEHLRANKPELSKDELLGIKELVTHCLTNLKLYISSFKISTNY